jgi:hypothetical protein
MKTNDSEKIVVVRKPDGRVLLTHSPYADSGETAEFEECFFAFRGKPRLASIIINGERELLSAQESSAVRAAIQQLAQRLDEQEVSRDWFPYSSQHGA